MLLYQGSVKNVLGPVKVEPQSTALVFQYTDAYSVFDWGRMPDLLPGKGQALALLSAYWFEKLAQASEWREFSKSQEALALRKANRFGSNFIEWGEKLKQEGLHTHYLGVTAPIRSTSDLNPDQPIPCFSLSAALQATNSLVVKPVSVVRPAFHSVLGRTIPDYQGTRNVPCPRLVPLEVVFRFSSPLGSSILGRVAKDPSYLASCGFPGVNIEQPQDFPILEPFTKLEPTDRVLTLQEAFEISGISAAAFQDLFFQSAWVAAFLRHSCAQAGLELVDGKLEWAVDAQGEIFLVDAIGPDELRLLKNGFQLSKEFLRNFYRHTPWYQAVENAKKAALLKGSHEWKKLVGTQPPPLSQKYLEIARHLYPALTHRITGKKWFTECWELDRILSLLTELTT